MNDKDFIARHELVVTFSMVFGFIGFGLLLSLFK